MRFIVEKILCFVKRRAEKTAVQASPKGIFMPVIPDALKDRKQHAEHHSYTENN